ncbi:HAMP domain-containing histidine kinase [Aggregicoccus sp. 17bor-14]|uniref:sensor histidine kinase n=1 Tax=Myxococcaceae TaxID=31 RepID=UPI00129D0B37|nr:MULTISPECIES: HAMP domain-containing sensor histidine kinase [Myxococcaceae]MBF5045276.1 HAMP domain-containing histidine kinase [Simulacricoccus sp. 17bor-14]MRI91017.1 HAMP domain-containing histidine kinase [Aggregicoccus sp. 17bor-14]
MSADAELQSFLDLLAASGEMGALYLAHPWEDSPLGPPARWSRSLRNAVAMILRMPTPAIVFWGPEQRQLYNAGYALIMGPRHPRFLGSPYRECWPDTAPMLDPWMQDVFLRDRVFSVDHAHIPLTRHGFTEEAYFTFTFSALRDDDGRIGGLWQPVVEVTGGVLSQRRTDTLRELALHLGQLDTASLDLERALAPGARDVPFCVLLEQAPGERGLQLRAQAGLELSAQGLQALDGLPRLRAAALRALETRASVALEVLDAPLAHAPRRPWPEPNAQALALPLQEEDGTRGVVVLGVSPRLRLDQKYREFLEALARELSVQLAAQRQRRAQALLLQQLREAVRSRDEFLSIASHELNTPLTSLRLQTQLAHRALAQEDGSLDGARAVRWVEQAERSTTRLARLVGDMLDISRIATGKLALQLESFDLAELAHECVERLAPQAQAQETRLVLGPCTPVHGAWDRFRIEQVLANLVTNALRYGERSPVTVTVGAARGPGGPSALLSVRDEGPGIAPADQERIFQRFERAVADRNNTGLGLGLYICREIVERHGGSIEVQSAPGAGTTFVVRLPAASPPRGD